MSASFHDDDDHHDDHRDHGDYPLPRDPDHGDEPAIVPTPQPPAVAEPFPVPKARRHLKMAVDSAKTAIANLKKLELGERVQLDGLGIDALVCGATDQQLPLREEMPHAGELRHRARNGDFDAYVGLALDELEDALAVLEAARVALHAVSLIGEQVPGAWGNLPPVLLAKKLNGLGHTILRGRIAGVNL